MHACMFFPFMYAYVSRPLCMLQVTSACGKTWTFFVVLVGVKGDWVFLSSSTMDVCMCYNNLFAAIRIAV